MFRVGTELADGKSFSPYVRLLPGVCFARHSAPIYGSAAPMPEALESTLAVREAAIRVLIADDHPFVRAGLVAVLSQEKDIEVVGEASNGERTIALSRERLPDVVLMDLRMPELDSVKAIEVIAREQPQIRILALTSYDGDADVRRALKAGARRYLLRDMLVMNLAAAVRAVHRGQRKSREVHACSRAPVM
jgi:YesN/AraC family two-component response regulator